MLHKIGTLHGLVIGPCRFILIEILDLNIMKNLILFFVTCTIATGAFLAGTTMDNPLPAFIVAFVVWMLFLYRVSKR